MTPDAGAAAGVHPARHIRQNVIVRRVLNPLVVSVGRTTVLYVRGRRTGKRLSVPMDPPFEWERMHYLVSPLGDGNWARNLRAAGEGELSRHGRLERFRAVELHGTERDAIVTAYANTITCGCQRYMRMLPDSADHPVFRLDPPGQIE